MKNTNKLIFTLSMIFTTNICLAEIYQWTDEDNNVYFSDTPPVSNEYLIVYSSLESEKIYGWKNDNGKSEYSDKQPINISGDQITELVFDTSTEYPKDNEQYSIINQAKRMSEYTSQLIKTREDKEFARQEQYRIAQQQEIMRMEEHLRKYGYGPKPYYYPYSNSMNRYSSQYIY
ncbi:MAG: DUF4124 domain-containing protein [Proteobacteria bacterium]|nr:DUF4124 domain-containing protein [Pseudomonadota bacterium]